MIMNKKALFAVICGAVLCAFLSSCVGDALKPRKDPTVFYVLNAKAEKPLKGVDKKCENLNISMLPVSLPNYMSRPQIVSASGDRLVIDEFNRWGETVESGVERVVAKNIETLLPGIHVFKYPSVSMEKTPLTLKITVNDCIGEVGGKLKFSASWQIVSNDSGQIAITEKFETSANIVKDSDSYVNAIGKSLEKLSEEISKRVLSIELELNSSLKEQK